MKRKKLTQIINFSPTSTKNIWRPLAVNTNWIYRLGHMVLCDAPYEVLIGLNQENIVCSVEDREVFPLRWQETYSSYRSHPPFENAGLEIQLLKGVITDSSS